VNSYSLSGLRGGRDMNVSRTMTAADKNRCATALLINVDCCRLTRRSVLRYAAIAAGTSLLPVLDPERAYASTYRARRSAPSSSAHVAINLELVTLTESSFVVTWYTALPVVADSTGRLMPAPGGTTLRVGTSPLTMKTVVDRDDATPYHYAEITGLEPGQTYYYTASSDGVPATPALSQFGSAPGAAVPRVPNAFTFTTPPAPKGEHLFTLALCNDLHLGETVAGLATSVGGVGLPPGISTPQGEPPYAETMSKALVADAKARHAQLLLAAGDISAEAVSHDLRDAKAILDGFGRYGQDYLVARGNHDRTHTDADCTRATCVPSKFGDGKYDHFREVWFPGAANGPTWSAHDVHGLHVIRTDTYDKSGNGGDSGTMSAEQFAWFNKEVATHKDQPTLVFGHHFLGAFDAAQGAAITSLYARSPGVFFQQAGHSHANALVANSGAPNVTFQQTGSVKEYPGGFALLRVHTGGYAYNFYKTRADLAREWSERTREEYQGLAPFQQMGSLADRNHVREVDLSGLVKAPARPVTPTVRHPVGSAPARTLASTGPGMGVAAAALALTATGVAVARATSGSVDGT
jgi:Icc protein